MALIPLTVQKMPDRNKARMHFTLTDDSLLADEQIVIERDYEAYMVDGAAPRAKFAAKIQKDIDRYKRNKTRFNTVKYINAPAAIDALLNTKG